MAMTKILDNMTMGNGNMQTVKVGWENNQKNKYIRVIEFENGYSASIVSHDLSYGGQEGLFEIAILHDGEMVYDTWITPDVIGHLDFAGVAATLKDIEELPPRN